LTLSVNALLLFRGKYSQQNNDSKQQGHIGGNMWGGGGGGIGVHV
jgi:hypothetical protein